MAIAVTFPNYQFTNPWAYATGGTNYGGQNVIPLASSQPNASLADGFPKQTMLPVTGGGTPPAGADFNGILNAITQHLAWVNAGGQYFWSSAISYNIGAVVQLGTSGAPGLGSVVSTVNGNTTNPNIAMTGWTGAAANVSFLPSGTGAVITTVQTKLQQTVSVLDFGADPTGATSSTAAFVAAQTFLANTYGGGVINVPPGVYSVNMNMNVSGIHIIGSGRNCTFIQPATNNPCFTLGNAGSNVIQCEISHLSIANSHGVVTSTGLGGTPAILVINQFTYSNDWWTFEDLYIGGPWGYGFQVLGVFTWARFIKCEIFGTDTGFEMSGGYLFSDNHIKFDHCRISHTQGYGLHVDSNASGQIPWTMFFDHLNVEYCGQDYTRSINGGVYLRGVSGFVMVDPYFENNGPGQDGLHAGDGNGYGLCIGGVVAEGFHIQGGLFHGNQRGIWIDAALAVGVISGAYLAADTGATGSAVSPLVISSNVSLGSNIVLEGNRYYVSNSGATFIGSISGSTLTVSSVLSGTIALNQALSGPVPNGLFILSGSGLTWTVAQIAASFTGTIASGILTASNGSGIAIGQTIIGTGIPAGTTIASGSGTMWTLSSLTINVYSPETMTTASVSTLGNGSSGTIASALPLAQTQPLISSDGNGNSYVSSPSPLTHVVSSETVANPSAIGKGILHYTGSGTITAITGVKGQRLTIINFNNAALTLQHAASGALNIFSPTQANVVLQKYGAADLYLDPASGMWQIISVAVPPPQPMGAIQASATTTPASGFLPSTCCQISGSAAISLLTLPWVGFTGCIDVLPTGAFTLATGGTPTGNSYPIRTASTAVVGKPYRLLFDGTMWNPSY